jgi:hypothetical protein
MKFNGTTGAARIIRLYLEPEYEPYRGILEAWILSKTQSLIGNYYSTFTGNACRRRHLHSCHYFKTYWPSLNVFAKSVSMLIAPLLLIACIMLLINIPRAVRAMMRTIVVVKERYWPSPNVSEVVHPVGMGAETVEDNSSAEDVSVGQLLLQQLKVSTIVTVALVVGVSAILTATPFEIAFGLVWAIVRWFMCYFTPFCEVPIAVKSIVTISFIIGNVGLVYILRRLYITTRQQHFRQKRREAILLPLQGLPVK